MADELRRYVAFSLGSTQQGPQEKGEFVGKDGLSSVLLSPAAVLALPRLDDVEELLVRLLDFLQKLLKLKVLAL